MLHVIPDERGNWRLFEGAGSAPLSRHNSATEAGLRAWSRVGARGDEEIVVHDRYGRIRPPVHYDVHEAETMTGFA